MPILKKNVKESGYTSIPNALLRDKSLSLSAKGLLCYMLSCTVDWKFSIKGISTVTGATEYQVQKLLKELEEKGYHKKEAQKDSNGKIIEWIYYVSDTPVFDLPDVEIPDVVNQAYNNTNNIKTNKDNNICAESTSSKKKSLYEKCIDEIEEVYLDTDIRNELKSFLSVRIKFGRLSAPSFRTIISELRELAPTKADAIAIIRNATAKGYMKFYPVSKSYSRGFKDDLQKSVSAEALMREKYREEMAMVFPEDRIPYEEWLKNVK